MNSSAPLVSIIIPFFNSARFLADAVESVLEQSLRNWELLLVDDGSTDTSGSIARNYVERYPSRIFYLHHRDRQNHGPAITRNFGLRHCRGEFVALLDSDDVWFPRKLEQQIALLRRYPNAAMVLGRSEYWYDWPGAPRTGQKNTIPDLAPEGLYLAPELLRLSYPLGPAPCPSDLVIRRSAIAEIGGFIEEFVLYEDIAFLAKVFLSLPVYVSEDCWDRYRVHPDSMSALACRGSLEAESRFFYFNWLADYMNQVGVVDKKLWELYRRKTRGYRHPGIAAVIQAVRRQARPIKRLLKQLLLALTA
jgi:glycosyltransferase involved in cell wall biosynthesis